MHLLADRAVEAAALDRITAIAVTYNSAHCLASLAPGLSGMRHVVLVDNASHDDTRAIAAKHIPHARLIANPSNVGFGAANNQALTHVSTPFVLLVNPDCAFEPQAVLTLLACADAFPTASAIGPQLTGRRGELDVSYRWPTSAWPSRGRHAEGPLCVGFISGACLLVRTEALRAIGGFDEAFFLYYEDDDLCLRLQRHAGALIVEPASRVFHQSRGSVGGKARVGAEYVRGYHHIQSKFLFACKHLGGAPTLTRRLRYIGTAGIEALFRLVLLDRSRAARAWGRVVGATRWRAP